MSTIKSSAENLTLNADGSGNDVIIQSNGSTKAIVTAEGTVGIGTVSPTAPLTVYGDRYDIFRIGRSDAASYNIGIPDGSATDYLEFKGVQAGYSGYIFKSDDDSKLLELKDDGDVTVNTGNLVIGTAGKGIDFSAQTATATGTTTSEVLDHYEEGTFTATLTAATPPTAIPTATGIYTRIGDVCYFNIYRFQAPNCDMTGASGKLQITGLPFAAHTEGTIIPAPATHTINFDVDRRQCFYLGASDTVLQGLESRTAAGWLDWDISSVGWCYLAVSGTYKIA